MCLFLLFVVVVVSGCCRAATTICATYAFCVCRWWRFSNSLALWTASLSGVHLVLRRSSLLDTLLAGSLPIGTKGLQLDAAWWASRSTQRSSRIHALQEHVKTMAKRLFRFMLASAAAPILPAETGEPHIITATLCGFKTHMKGPQVCQQDGHMQTRTMQQKDNMWRCFHLLVLCFNTWHAH